MTKQANKGIVEYPISVNYRKGWGEWEAIREIMQNAMDNGSASWNINNDTSLIIKDDGQGISLKHLLIGESSKDGISSVGKFGEGLKFGLLALVREHKTVEIRSNGLILVPGLKKMFETETLTIKWAKNPKPVIGTTVAIHGLEDPSRYMHRFLTMSLRSNMQARILTKSEHAGELYIKGIYVKDIPSKVGYNLNMERENPMSGDVDMREAEIRIAKLLEATADRDVMSRMIRTYKEKQHRNIEYSSGTWRTWDMKHKRMWKQEAVKAFGNSHICIASNPDASKSAEYKGFEVLYDACSFFEGFLKKDVEAVPKKKHKQKNVGMSGLKSNERANIRWARDLIERAMEQKIKRLEIVIFEQEDSNTLGLAKYETFIKVCPEMTSNRENCLETLLHEAVHYYFGCDDLTHSFAVKLALISQRVITMTLKDSVKPASKAAPQKDYGLDREKIKSDWLEIYVQDCFDGDDNEIFGALENRLDIMCNRMATLSSIGKTFGAKGCGGKKKNVMVQIAADAIRESHKQ